MSEASDPLDLIYRTHPLREETILARVARTRGTLDGITEFDLAHDSVTEITDQNHIGGIVAVVRLALRAGVTPASRVLDLGCGLGGSVRAVALLFGCRAHGVELTRRRCDEAERLTSRVNLQDVVTFTHGDATTVAVDRGAFDVVWGQGAWMHIAELTALFKTAATALCAGGRIAFEEAWLARSPATDAERHSLADLERLWAGRFLTLDEWSSALASASCVLRTVDDETDAFVHHVDRLAAIARVNGPALYPADEAEALERASQLARSGVIRYVRAIADAPK